MPSDPKITDKQYIVAAQKKHDDEGTLEIDDNAKVSRNEDGDDGAYVQTWVWVPNEEAITIEVDLDENLRPKED